MKGQTTALSALQYQHYYSVVSFSSESSTPEICVNPRTDDVSCALVTYRSTLSISSAWSWFVTELVNMKQVKFSPLKFRHHRIDFFHKVEKQQCINHFPVVFYNPYTIYAYINCYKGKVFFGKCKREIKFQQIILYFHTCCLNQTIGLLYIFLHLLVWNLCSSLSVFKYNS